MDFKAFSEESFDAVNWVNEAFATAGDTSNKESYASNLVYKLQLFVQEINNSLEETAQQVIHNMPKVLQEAESLQDDVDKLKQDMAEARENMDQLNSESVNALSELKTASEVKSKMASFLQQKQV